MSQSFSIFFQFLKRDFYSYRHRLKNLIINYGLLYPSIFAFGIGYVQAHSYFGNSATTGTVVYIGHILIIVLVLANTINTGLLFDLEQNRFIDYQITLLSPRLVLVEKIVFATILTFMLSIPFFPVSKIVMGNSFDGMHISWPSVFLLLFVGSLCCSAYTLFCACVIKSSRFLRSYWMRVNFGLITFGGIFIPYYTYKQFSPLLAYATLLNPMIYITEGLRRAITADPLFLPIWLCIAALLSFTLFFTLLSWYFFKKRVDHI